MKQKKLKKMLNLVIVDEKYYCLETKKHREIIRRLKKKNQIEDYANDKREVKNG